MFDSTMLDDVRHTLTCSVDPFGQALTARNIIVDEKKKKKNSTLRSPHTVSLVPQFTVSFLRICYDDGDDDDDDDDVITEFATSCPLIVL